MTNLAQFMLDAAALMRKHGLLKVENLLARPDLVQALQANQKGLALLHDLRKHSTKGLQNEARDLQKEFEVQQQKAQRSAKERAGTHFYPLPPEEVSRVKQAAAARRKAS